MRRALALALLISSVACSRELLDVDPFQEPDLSASVRLPLSTSLDDGTTYLLQDATVEIGGAAMLTLRAAEGDLTTPLPAGSYTLFLRPGYRVIEVSPAGERREIAVEARSQNPQYFTVREVEDATLRLSFAHGERELVFGARAPVRLTRR
ncbi:MAG TPA: hypothetical protein VFX59_24200 [Polyangiales bacterium]|nr:hypothetical protein [Polyangiales bacterium]